MKITVITACFNSASTIADTLASVRAQTHPDIEHLVIDGDSQDATLDIVSRYPERLAKVVSEPDRGIYDALNKGLALATGEITAILHADDIYAHADVLARVAGEFERSGADTVYGDLVYVDRDNPERVVRYWRSGEFRRSSFRWGWMPPHPAFFARSEVYARHGGFDLRLRSAADYELMLRLLYVHGLSAAYIPEVLTLMRLGGVSNASPANRLRANAEDRLAWRLNGLRPNPLTFILKPLRKIGQYVARPPRAMG